MGVVIILSGGLIVLSSLILFIAANDNEKRGLTLRSKVGFLDGLVDKSSSILASIGINTSTLTLKYSLVVVCILTILISFIFGAFGLALYFITLYLVIKALVAQQREMVNKQLIDLVEELSRELMAGYNLEQSFRRVSVRCSMPLHQIMRRVLERRALGMEIDEALLIEATALKNTDLKLLSTLIKINKVYGGKMKNSLSSLAKIMRDKDKSKRELRAMTGETRVTAFVLAFMPIFIGGYMLVTNPEYTKVMFTTTAGIFAFCIAVGLQISGIAVMWRMLKSI